MEFDIGILLVLQTVLQSSIPFTINEPLFCKNCLGEITGIDQEGQCTLVVVD